MEGPGHTDEACRDQWLEAHLCMLHLVPFITEIETRGLVMKKKASSEKNDHNGCKNNWRGSEKISIPMSENRFLTSLIRQVIFSRCHILYFYEWRAHEISPIDNLTALYIVGTDDWIFEGLILWLKFTSCTLMFYKMDNICTEKGLLNIKLIFIKLHN